MERKSVVAWTHVQWHLEGGRVWSLGGKTQGMELGDVLVVGWNLLGCEGLQGHRPSLGQPWDLEMEGITNEPPAIISGFLKLTLGDFCLPSGLQIFNVLLIYVQGILSTTGLKMSFQF